MNGIRTSRRDFPEKHNSADDEDLSVVRHLPFILTFVLSGVAVLSPIAIDDATRAIPVEPKRATVTFLGDMMFDRSIRRAAEIHGYEYLFSAVNPVLEGSNLIVANLEGPVTQHSSVSVDSFVGEPSNTRFTFSPEVLLTLDDRSILLNLGNNHSLDFGESGVAETLQYTRETEIPVFGDLLGVPAVHRVTIHATPLAVIGYNQFSGSRGEGNAIEAVKNEFAAGNIPIVYAHWSEEYERAPTPAVQALAHTFVEAGAKLVIGSHPHVIGEQEVYRGVPIFYSLGNFIFDQYFSQAVRCGLVLTVVFEKGEIVELKQQRVWLADTRQTVPDSGECGS